MIIEPYRDFADGDILEQITTNDDMEKVWIYVKQIVLAIDYSLQNQF